MKPFGDRRQDYASNYSYSNDKRIYSVFVICVTLLFYAVVVYKDFPGQNVRNPGPYDAIVILGGGRANDDGSAPEWTRLRCDKGLHIWKALPEEQRPVFVTISAGTAHTPNLRDEYGKDVYESTTTAKYLVEHGVPANMIYRETVSFDTIGNAYFTRTIFTDIRDWKRLVIITSDFHMDRTKAIFDLVFSLPPIPYDEPYQLTYTPSVDGSSLDPSIAKERDERNRKNRARFVDATSHIRSLPEFMEWMYQTHRLYAVSRMDEAPEEVSAGIRAGYGGN